MIKAQITTGISKKTGREYVCVDVYITDTYKKRIFLDDAEIELAKLNYPDLLPSNS